MNAETGLMLFLLGWAAGIWTLIFGQWASRAVERSTKG